MTTEKLVDQIKKKKSFLCVGLDIDLDKIPPHLKDEEDPIFSFAKAIIDATHKFAVAYKPNLAFFESYGVEGWQAFRRIMDYLNTHFQIISPLQMLKEGILEILQTDMLKLFLKRIMQILLRLLLTWERMLLSRF